MLYLSLDALLRDTRIAPKLRSCSPLLTRLCETNMMFTPRKCKARMRMHVPCKFYSTVRVRVRARRVESAPLIEQTRDMLGALFEHWVIENVLGARLHLALHAVDLRGAWFGLHVDRPRLFEASTWTATYASRARGCVSGAASARGSVGGGRTHWQARAPALLHGQPLCGGGTARRPPGCARRQSAVEASRQASCREQRVARAPSSAAALARGPP